MNTLQRYLLANALFSSLCGLCAISLQEPLQQLFDVPPGPFFLVLGLLLLFFVLTLTVEFKKQRGLAVLWIIVQDLLWVLGSIYLLIWDPFHISPEGNIVIALVATVVLIMALGQSKGLSQLDEDVQRGFKVLQFSRKFPASVAKVWTLVSDVGNYHQVAPNIDDSRIVSGEKEGMVRACSHGDDKWTETCVLWEEQQQYAFLVNTDAADYPYPLKHLKGTWITRAISEHQTEVQLRFEFAYNKAWQKLLLHPFLKHQFTKVCRELLNNWEAKLR